MNCKFCNAELEEQNSVCPACGKDNEAPQIMLEPVKPRRRTWLKIVIAAVVGAALVLFGAAAGVLLSQSGVFGGNAGTEPTETEASQTGTNPTYGISAAVKDQYIAEGDALHEAMDDVIVTMEGKTLTNAQFQVYYWMQVYNFLEYYGTQVDIDLSKPLAEQIMSGETTWEQYFVDLSLATWKRYQILCIEAEKAGYSLPDDVKQSLADMKAGLEEAAQEYEFESAEAMIQADMGPGCTVEAYLDYMYDYYLGVCYFNAIYETMNPTEEEISEYFDAHADDFESQYGVTKESGKLVDVRHILIEPEGCEKDSNGYVTATDAQWEACRKEAQALLDSWKKGEATEEAFAQLANEHSVDGGSNTNGGLYSQVPTGYMVEAFDAWMFDESRQVGDTGLVKTEFGYHIMYYSAGEESWLIYGRDGLVSEMSSQMLDTLTESIVIDVDYETIVLGQADLSANIE